MHACNLLVAAGSARVYMLLVAAAAEFAAAAAEFAAATAAANSRA